MKCHNPYTYYLLASESNFILYKYTLCLLLDISLQKSKGIVKNYYITVRLDYGTKGITYDGLGIKELKSQAINFITELAKIEGETSTIRFMREEHKLFIYNAVIKTIQLLFYYTEHCIYRNYY